MCSNSTKRSDSRTRRIDGVVVNTVLFHQPVGDILAHRERVEERALLKNHPEFAAQGKKVLLAHLRHFVAQDGDAS